MTVELISVGTELLLGNIVNTNAAYLAEKCADLGLSCFYQSVVGVMHEPSKKRIEEYFTSRNMELTENNWKQAMMPEGAIAVNNENGTAPGVIIEDGEKKVILLPGPPNEMIPMFEKSIMPYLEGSDPEVIYSQTVKICGVGESKAETLIKDMIDSQSNPTIATYAKNCEVHLRVTAKAAGEKEAKKLVTPVVKELKNRFGPCIYTTNADITLEKAVVDLLIANKLTVSTVESCTGGMLAARLINVSGVSDVYKSGYITYSNKAKRRILGIKKGLLEKKGAVSEEVAKEMAKGAAAISRAEVAVSITGIAGPGGGTEEKPVGLVYIACSVCGKIKVRKYNFRGNRAKIRETAVSSALILMRQCVLEYYSEVAF